MRWCFVILLIVVVVGSFGVHSLVNQPLFDVNRDELSSVSMTVHGPDGQPIAGAEVSIHGLRTVKEPASGHGNRMQNKATTNEKGEVTIEYSRFVSEEISRPMTAEICTSVTTTSALHREKRYNLV